VFVAKALARETVGPVEHERAGHIVRFMARDLGVIDGVGRVHRFAPLRSVRGCAPFRNRMEQTANSVGEAPGSKSEEPARPFNPCLAPISGRIEPDSLRRAGG
jgi:hypothetical protein